MKRIYRVTLEYSIDIDETIEESSIEGVDQEYAERQNRLLQAILSDPERLSTYLSYQVSSDLAGMTYGHWYELLLDSDFLTKPYGDAKLAAILKSSIATLPETDQTFFNEVEEEGIFFENTEDMQRCFSSSLEKVEIEELEVVKK